MAPFLAALAVIVVVVIAIWLSNFFQGDEQNEDKRVATAAVAQNDALQRQNYADFRAYTCRAEHGTEPDFLGRQRESVAAQGERYVDGVSNLTIDGDRATATVTYHFDKAPDAKTNVETTFVREEGAWKVCSPTAR
jgi:hypothetical protein